MALIALHNTDKTSFPNLALMKLSAAHKSKGDTVERFMPIKRHLYDKVYSAKIFTYSKHDEMLPDNAIKGGTGYDIKITLLEEIEHICPDYNLYGLDYSLGFTTRGCVRKCPWCVVPEKEGNIREHARIEEFLRHKQVKLLDNNILAHDHGIRQLEKLASMGVKVDINQGLDARLIDGRMAALLGRLKWIRFIRMSCDTPAMLPIVINAVDLMRKVGCKAEYFCYVLVDGIESALYRVEALRRAGINSFAQPYRPLKTNEEPAKELKHFARWVNLKPVFNTVPWSEYNPALG